MWEGFGLFLPSSLWGSPFLPVFLGLSLDLRVSPSLVEPCWYLTMHGVGGELGVGKGARADTWPLICDPLTPVPERTFQH